MVAPAITVYFDYKSPFAFLAKDLAYQLAEEEGITLEWRPFTLNIPDFLGGLDDRSDHRPGRQAAEELDGRARRQQAGEFPG